MKTYREINQKIRGVQSTDGAGVKLSRIFGFRDQGDFDPFLLLDFFGSDKPEDYIAGFPWHPHRGMETVTYMLDGKVEHGDSMGNKGVIGKGDVQWMTAGSGIIHQEMPLPDESKMYGFQLWVNLPASQKMIAPRYQEIKADTIPEIKLGKGVIIKIIAGEIAGKIGPVKDIIIEPNYYDIELEENCEFDFEIENEHTTFVYVFEGEGYFGKEHKEYLTKGEGALLSHGSNILIRSKDKTMRFLLISGKAINEPIAWGGPIVMNTREELETAFREYEDGTFIK